MVEKCQVKKSALGNGYAPGHLCYRHEQRLLSSIVAAEGFEPNHDKTAIMRRGGRQVVTGLVVNDVPKVSRRDTRRFRAIAHKCRTDGYVVVSESLGCDARSYLKGYLSFVNMVNEVQALRLERLCPPGLFDM